MLDIAGVLAATGQRTVVVPRPHPTLVTRRVLVMERLRGFKIDDDVDRIEELRIDERRAAPDTEMTPDELAAETRELVTSMASHGARLPKDLFHFIKGMALQAQQRERTRKR